MEPDWGLVSSSIWLSVVDLPEPDSPTMPRVRPCSRVKLMPSTARTSPTRLRNTAPLVRGKVLERSVTCSTSGGSPAPKSNSGCVDTPKISAALRPATSSVRMQAAA